MSDKAEGNAGRALALLCTVQFMLVLDNAIANVALPRIQNDLGFSQGGLQYVVSLYALTFGGFLILAGRAGDLFGRRRLLVAGVALFTIASLLCGLAKSEAVLLAARAAQGLGGALAAPSALALITTMFIEDAARNRALGIFGAVAATGASAGLLVGGVLTDVLSWRWVFFINVPVGVATLLLAPRLLYESRESGEGRRLDLPGAVTITAGLALLVFGVTRAQDDGFLATVPLVLLAGSAALLVAFIEIERTLREPLVPFAFFRRRAVTAANIVAFATTAVVAGQGFFSTLYLQQVLGFSPIKTGLSFLPLSLAAFAGSAIASQLAGRTGTRSLLVCGLTLLAAGSLWLSRIEVGGDYLDVLGPFVIFGLGLGLSFVSQTITATAGVPAGDQGLASGLLNTSQQLGFAVGIAVLVTVAVDATERSAAGNLAARTVDGFQTGLLVAGVIALAGALLAALLVPRVRPEPPTDEASRPSNEPARAASSATHAPGS